MKTTLRKIGNSVGVLIPKPFLAELGRKAGDPVDLRVKKGRITIEPVKRKARAGWAEARARIASIEGEGVPESTGKGREDRK